MCWFLYSFPGCRFSRFRGKLRNTMVGEGEGEGKGREKGREGQEGGRDGRAHLEARPGLGGKKAKKHPFGRFQK